MYFFDMFRENIEKATFGIYNKIMLTFIEHKFQVALL